MTSKENNTQTIEFFKKHNYFEYGAENIKFFIQTQLPMLSEDGKILLESKSKVRKAADGHGGIFKTILNTGMLEDMKSKNIKWIYIGAVDNILSKMVDSLLVGITIDKKLLDVEFPQRYGGNIRVFIGRTKLKTGRTCIDEILERESNYFEQFKGLEKFIIEWKKTKLLEIENYVEKYGELKAKAFPGRAAILVKLLGLSTKHISTVYEKPGSMKIGYYVPGTRIEIHSDEELFIVEDKTQPILNMAWHISK